MCFLPMELSDPSCLVESKGYLKRDDDGFTLTHSDFVGLLVNASIPVIPLEVISVLQARYNIHIDFDFITATGLWHDCGKRGVPKGILLKNGGLSDREFGIIQRHPEDGLTAIELDGNYVPTLIAKTIVSHHLRWGMRSYPRISHQDKDSFNVRNLRFDKWDDFYCALWRLADPIEAATANARSNFASNKNTFSTSLNNIHLMGVSGKLSPFEEVNNVLPYAFDLMVSLLMHDKERFLLPQLKEKVIG